MPQNQFNNDSNRVDWHSFRVVLGRAYRGLTGRFLLFRNFSVAISVSPHCLCYLSFNSDFYVLSASDLPRKPNN